MTDKRKVGNESLFAKKNNKMNQSKGRFPRRLSALYISEEMKSDLDKALIKEREVKDNPHLGKPDILRKALEIGLEKIMADNKSVAA